MKMLARICRWYNGRFTTKKTENSALAKKVAEFLHDIPDNQFLWPLVVGGATVLGLAMVIFLLYILIAHAPILCGVLVFVGFCWFVGAVITT